MLPLIPIAAVAGIAGLAYALSGSKPKPPQTMSSGTKTVSVPVVPLSVPVPVITPPKPALSPDDANANTGVGAKYNAAVVVAPSKTPGVLTLAPTVITAGGAASMAVSTPQDVQNAMNTLGVVPLTNLLKIDGQIGPQSQAAIRTFQTAHGLPTTGQADDGTKKAIQLALADAANSNPDVGSHPSVAAATHATPSAVNSAKDIQHALNLLGATPPLTEDGKIGPASTAAIKAFQLSHGLTADGIAGPMTKQALTLALGRL